MELEKLIMDKSYLSLDKFHHVVVFNQPNEINIARKQWLN